MSGILDVDAETAISTLLAAGAVVVAMALGLSIVRRLLYICRPNEILIFSGRKHELADGSTVGYKVVRQGWALRVPLLQTISRMDMRLFMVEVKVANAYSQAGIPLAVHAIANIKLASANAAVRNAVERFLGMQPQQIAGVARQTLEGVLREVVAQLTPEEVNQDRLKFAESLRSSAQDDFDKLGLELDVLKVQHVSDEQQYLQNLGRARIALMLRDAQNAENEANQRIAEEEASARQRAQSAQKKAEATVLQKQNMLRAELARMEGQAKAVENEAAVAAETARANAEQELQRLRGELETARLQCDVVLPAEAGRLAAEARARGQAAPVVENGKAAAEALRAVAAEWKAAGQSGREVYLLQQLRPFVEAAVARVAQTQVDELNIVDGGDGQAYAAFVANFPAAVARVMAETAHAVGVDVRSLLGTAGTGAAR
jgi:flotillin